MRHPNAFVWLAIFVGPLAQSALAQTLRAAQPVWTAQSDQLERANRDVDDMLRGGELFAVRSQLDSQIAGRVHERFEPILSGAAGLWRSSGAMESTRQCRKNGQRRNCSLDSIAFEVYVLNRVGAAGLSIHS